MLETKKNSKNSLNFFCEKCDFKCSSKSDWSKHIIRPKHHNNMSRKSLETKKLKKTHNCLNCDKIFLTNSGLWKHKKVCNKITENLKMQYNKNDSDKELIIFLLKQNNDLLEVIKNTNQNIITNNNINSNNKMFNLNVFLNETCKDAMNIMDFVDSIKLQLSDLEKVGKMGYVEGISNIITSNLKALDITQRPIHCTDKKREVMYVKDENKWEKDEEKNKLRNVIKNVASKNQRILPQFKEKYPDCNTSVSQFSDQYNKIIIESMGGYGENDLEKEDKIIKNIAKNVLIDK
jgi:hypothetical protein